MTIPKTVRVLHRTYRVEEVDNLHNEKSDLLGQTNWLDQMIFLNRAASKAQKNETLLHEAVHVMDDVFQIGLKERQIELLGVAIYNFVLDNPDLFGKGT